MNKKKTNDNTPVHIAAAVQSIRIEKGVTPKGLADRAGISDRYVREIEAGERYPSLPVLVRIALALDVSLDYLVFGCESDLELHRTYKRHTYVPAVGGRLIRRAIENAVHRNLYAEYPDVESLVEIGWDISFNYYQEITRGDKTPSVELLISLVNLLDVTLDALIWEAE